MPSRSQLERALRSVLEAPRDFGGGRPARSNYHEPQQSPPDRGDPEGGRL